LRRRTAGRHRNRGRPRRGASIRPFVCVDSFPLTAGAFPFKTRLERPGCWQYAVALSNRSTFRLIQVVQIIIVPTTSKKFGVKDIRVLIPLLQLLLPEITISETLICILVEIDRPGASVGGMAAKIEWPYSVLDNELNPHSKWKPLMAEPLERSKIYLVFHCVSTSTLVFLESKLSGPSSQRLGLLAVPVAITVGGRRDAVGNALDDAFV